MVVVVVSRSARHDRNSESRFREPPHAAARAPLGAGKRILHQAAAAAAAATSYARRSGTFIYTEAWSKRKEEVGGVGGKKGTW